MAAQSSFHQHGTEAQPGGRLDRTEGVNFCSERAATSSEKAFVGFHFPFSIVGPIEESEHPKVENGKAIQLPAKRRLAVTPLPFLSKSGISR